MDAELQMDITGDVLSRQELLNGTETITLDGRSHDGAWSVAFEFSWNRGLVDVAGEGDITLSREDGGEVFGSLAAARAFETADGALQFELRYELDGGSGAFRDASGVAEGSGTLGAESCQASRSPR